MNIIFCEDYEEMSKKAAAVIVSQLILKPRCALGLATGSTPEGLYQNLSDYCKNGDISFAQVQSYNLDEYIGLSPDHPQSYAYYMKKYLFERVDIDPDNINIPNGMAADLDAECRDYSERLNSISGGLDLQLLGIGENGHIGFNEPDDKFTLDTHVVSLSDLTIDSNSRSFACRDDVPRKALTVGIRPIMAAKQILLLASGSSKSDVLEAALFGGISSRIPASILQLHRGLTIVADRAALAKTDELHPGDIFRF